MMYKLNTRVISFQWMKEEFKQKIRETASSAQTTEEEQSESEDIAICGESPPQIIWTHQQHWADYVQIGVEEGVTLTLGGDREAPLITEVHFFSFQIFYSHSPSNSSSLSCIFHHLIFQVLQKIYLANHIKRMADLLHADAVQQLNVAILGSLVADVVTLLSAGFKQTKPILQTMQPCPKTYTSTPPASIPMAVLLLGISTISTSGIWKTEKATESQGVPVIALKCHCIILMPVTASASPQPSTSSSSSSLPSKSASYPVIVIPELAILVEAYPEHVNQPSSKDYLCRLYTFWHSNLNCILPHIRKHLDITISCPGCGKGFQNAASLHKHGKEAHRIQIVTSSEEH